MFTGIIEALGTVSGIEPRGGDVRLTVLTGKLDMSDVMLGDSIAVNGVCLTVIEINEEEYTVTAIKETLEKTNLGLLSLGEKVNLERCTKLGERLDGHLVQGHVDQTGYVDQIEQQDGSWKFYIKYDPSLSNITVNKGSITINGTSLTVVDSFENSFSVCIIPFTFERTNFNSFKIGTLVNLEFDIVGKYLNKLNSLN